MKNSCLLMVLASTATATTGALATFDGVDMSQIKDLKVGDLAESTSLGGWSCGDSCCLLSTLTTLTRSLVRSLSQTFTLCLGISRRTSVSTWTP